MLTLIELAPVPHRLVRQWSNGRGAGTQVIPKVEFKRLEKVFFPATGFTKGDLVNYYVQIAPVLVPHFRGRPVTIIRMPNGIKGEGFYEKNAPGYAPAWFPRPQVAKSSGEINYMMIQDARALAWIANDAAVELHPFLHKADSDRRPTHIAFNLDPREGADLLTCIVVGFLVRDVLERLNLKSFHQGDWIKRSPALRSAQHSRKRDFNRTAELGPSLPTRTA